MPKDAKLGGAGEEAEGTDTKPGAATHYMEYNRLGQVETETIVDHEKTGIGVTVYQSLDKQMGHQRDIDDMELEMQEMDIQKAMHEQKMKEAEQSIENTRDEIKDIVKIIENLVQQKTRAVNAITNTND